MKESWLLKRLCSFPVSQKIKYGPPTLKHHGGHVHGLHHKQALQSSLSVAGGIQLRSQDSVPASDHSQCPRNDLWHAGLSSNDFDVLGGVVTPESHFHTEVFLLQPSGGKKPSGITLINPKSSQEVQLTMKCPIPIEISETDNWTKLKTPFLPSNQADLQ